MLQTVASLADDSRGIIYYRNLFIVQAPWRLEIILSLKNLKDALPRQVISPLTNTRLSCKLSNLNWLFISRKQNVLQHWSQNDYKMKNEGIRHALKLLHLGRLWLYLQMSN
jgi:hypothetical protein